MDKLDKLAHGFLFSACIFLIAVDEPKWAPLIVQWAWKGVLAWAAWYKGLHTEKPEKI